MSEEPEELGPVDDGDDYDLAATATPRPNRITVVETVYHQVGDDEPTSVDSRFSRTIESDEQVYERRHKGSQAATFRWKKLDYGWVDSPGMVVIRNDEKAGTLMVAYGDGSSGFFVVLQGESFRCCPSGVLSIRAVEDTVAFTLYAFPV